jgi:hypothetical protein
MIREGAWWTHSKSDPRWNGSGQALVGGFVIPDEAKEFIEQKKQALSEGPPKDLTFGYMKD